MITASQLQRLIACPESYALPQVDRLSDAADAGTEAHKVLADRCARGDIDMPDGVPAHAWQTEHAFAVDMADGSARSLGIVINRDYADVRPFEIAGTCDAFALEITSERRHGYVVDWKTGRTDVEHPSKNAQLLFYALAIARAYALDTVTVVVGRTYGIDPETTQPRYTSAVVDALDLDAFFVKLKMAYDKATAAKLRGKVESVTAGPHCTYCKAFTNCPSVQGLVSFVGKSPTITTQGGSMADLLTLIAQAKELARQGEAIVRSAAEREPIRLPSGELWGKYTTQGNEKIDDKLASQIVIRRLPANVLEVNCSKAAIERAVKATGVAGKDAAAQARSIVDEMRACGAVTRTMKTEYGVIPAQKLAGESEEMQ